MKRIIIWSALAVMPLLAIGGQAEAKTKAGGGHAVVLDVPAKEAAAAAAYWTPARMAAATALDADRTGGTAQAPTVSAQAKCDDWNVTCSWEGSPVIGAIFQKTGNGDHTCTASVVHSAKRNVILTAAHCLYHKSTGQARYVVFVPKYHNGSRPYGMFTFRHIVVDSRWMSKEDPDLDFGFASTNKGGLGNPTNSRGKWIENVVGANRLLINQAYSNVPVMIAGHPVKAEAYNDSPVYCYTHTHKYKTFQMYFDCTYHDSGNLRGSGFGNGTSGSPWLTHYDGKKKRGDVIGVIGGYQKGGPPGGRSYSAYFDHDIQTLKNKADSLG
ncbi:hypothetical protein GCM10029978_009180 [Actinoallomurus acanthiterrae]